MLDGARSSNAEGGDPPAKDQVVAIAREAVSRRGDLWQLGRHALICGDARESADYDEVTFNEPVDLIFTDPPYNCPIDGHVCGLGKVKHREFAMAAGEMSDQEFIEFLSTTLGLAASKCKDGAIAFVCMDWRGMEALLTAGRTAFTEQKQLCVWNKTNGGMGTFYRSKHELVFVYKVGQRPTRIASASERPVAIGRTCGTILALAVPAHLATPILPGTRPRSRLPWSLTRSVTARGVARSCSTHLLAQEPLLSRQRCADAVQG